MKNNLRIIRAEKRLSQEKLAVLTGLSRATINGIENEKVMPNTKTILCISKALNEPIQNIFLDFVLCENTKLHRKI